MSPSESDTRSKLIDPALYARGWKEDNIKREETAGAVDMRDGRRGDEWGDHDGEGSTEVPEGVWKEER